MNQSETVVALTAEDIAKIKAGRVSSGCLWIPAVPVTLFILWWFSHIPWLALSFSNALYILVVAGVPVLFLVAVFMFMKKKNGQISRDLAAGQKKIIIAPITDKRIESRDIKRGWNKGGVSMKYFMTIAGSEYPMTEQQYLTIPVGEFMEIQLAPVSKIILEERWLKQERNII